MKKHINRTYNPFTFPIVLNELDVQTTINEIKNLNEEELNYLSKKLDFLSKVATYYFCKKRYLKKKYKKKGEKRYERAKK